MRSLLILTLLAAGPPPAVALRTRRLLRGPAYEGHAISSASTSARRLEEKALDDDTIHQAVRDWFDDDKKDDVTKEYGSIENWNVKGVTRMTNLFCAGSSYCGVDDLPNSFK